MKKIKISLALVTVAFVIFNSAFTRTTVTDYYLYSKFPDGLNFDIYVIDPASVDHDTEIISCCINSVDKCRVSISGTPVDQGDVLFFDNVSSSSFSLFGTSGKYARVVPL